MLVSVRPDLRRRPATWAVRAFWLLLAVAVAPAVTGAVSGASTPVRWLAAVGLWAAWAGGLVAALVPSPLSLTALRILTPAAVPVVVAAAADGADPVAAAVVAVGVIVVFSPLTGEEHVDAAAYGAEERTPLRAPGPLLLGPIPLAWAGVVAGASTGPLLLAARQWLAGALATALGLVVAALLARSLHVLSRRWLVFVPAGLVVHDPLALVDAVLCRRADTVSVGPALADTTAEDLTLGALGTPLEVRLSRPVGVVRSRPGRSTAESRPVDALLVAPTRPGRALERAAGRRFPTGLAT